MSAPLLKAFSFPLHADPQGSSKEDLPTMYDLPSEDPEEPGLPDEFHLLQPQLLRETFVPPHCPPEQVFVAADMNVYYQSDQPYWYKRPDWFAVLGGSRLYEGHDMRLSYVIWQEKRPPNIVIELLSPGTDQEDLGMTVRDAGKPPCKWEVYERYLQVPYYFVFSRYSGLLRAFHLYNGRYQRQHLPLPCQRFWVDEVGLGLGVWEGEYESVNTRWIRWYDKNDNWLPCAKEQTQIAQAEAQTAQAEAQAAQAEAQAAQNRAAGAEEKAYRMAERLRALGIDPDSL